jgi:hypothetical protein
MNLTHRLTISQSIVVRLIKKLKQRRLAASFASIAGQAREETLAMIPAGLSIPSWWRRSGLLIFLVPTPAWC